MATESLERLTEQFHALCTELPSRLDDHEVERLAALAAAKKAVHRLQTPSEFAENQIWAPIDLAGSAIALDLGIPEILSESKEPVSFDEITSRTKGDSVVTYRVLRFLAAQGMVDQISEDFYAANRITRDYTSDTRRASVFKQLFCTPAYATLPWFLRETRFQNPTNADDCAWQRGLNTNQNFWQWMEARPEMSDYFNKMMQMTRGKSRDTLAQQFPFEKILNDTSSPDKVAFIDVGGGFGHQCISLRNVFPREYGRFILQDLPFVVKGKKIQDVEVMPIDIMEGQPIKGAKIYYLRGVCHDHCDEVNRKFLKHIVEAMDEKSTILIDEKIVPEINPTVLATRADLMMMSQFAAMERSARQFKDLLGSVGLKVIGQHGSRTSEWKILEAVLA